jgi:hypothetical protein
MSEALTNDSRDDGSYPKDSPGSCLVIGTPPPGKESEPVPIDLLRAVLTGASETKAHLQQSNPAARLRVEIFGKVPRHLTARDSDATAVLRANASGESEGHGDDIETRVASVIAAIKGFGNMRDLDIVNLSERLREPKKQVTFYDSFTSARGNLNQWLQVKKKGQAEPEPIVFKQALLALVPDWLKANADQATLDYLLNYALAEVLRIISKVTEKIVLFHYRREERYLTLAQAYMGQILGLGEETVGDVDRYVRMPRDIDGIKLPPPPDTRTKSRRVRLSAAEPYRAPKPDQRILLFPADSVDGIMGKLGQPHIPKDVADQYVFSMIGGILRLSRDLLGHQAGFRGRLARALPDSILDDPETMAANRERTVGTLHELVLDPISTAIEAKLNSGSTTDGADAAGM